MNRYSPSKPFLTPREYQGQIVTYSYAIDPYAEVIVERRFDASDRTTSYTAFQFPNDDSDFNPGWDVPTLGSEIGPCTITGA